LTWAVFLIDDYNCLAIMGLSSIRPVKPVILPDFKFVKGEGRI